MSIVKYVFHELKEHSPFTLIGSIVGVLLMFLMRNMPYSVSYKIFYTLHPAHVFLSSFVTTSMYRLHKDKYSFWKVVLIGYFGSIGVATLSNSIIPFIGETLLKMPNAEAHIGFLEEWWIVNPIALLAIGLAYLKPYTKMTHAGHIFVSTAASLFHIMMAKGSGFSPVDSVLIVAFLFSAVWLPCCTSDIVFPLLFTHSAKHIKEKLVCSTCSVELHDHSAHEEVAKPATEEKVLGTD
jgi:hypothetical protein